MSNVDEKTIWAETFVPTLFWPTRLTPSLRLKFFLTGVVYPLICLAVNSMDGPPTMESSWQSGDFSVYAIEILSPPAFYYLLPIVLYSMICIGWWCLVPSSFCSVFVWAGIYSGVIYSAILTVLLMSFTVLLGPFFAAIVMGVQAAVVWFGGNVIKRVYRFTILHLMICTTVVAVLVSLGIKLGWDFREIFFPLALFVVGGASTMAFVTFCRVSKAVYHLNNTEPKSYEAIGVSVFVAWILASIFSWRMAIIAMLDQYSRLPLEPPEDCFISNAAAHGYPILVGSKLGNDGRRRNLQMARLKFLEFVIEATSTSLHRIFRKIYNRAGPPLARYVRVNICLASLAFLALLPLSVLAVLLQKCIFIPDAKVRQLYKL